MTPACPCCGAPIVELPDPTKILAGLALTRTERRVADRLAQSFGHFVETWQLVEAVYFDDPEGGPLTASNIVAIVTLRLRRKLALSGFAIEAAGKGKGNGGRRMIWSPAGAVS